MRTERQGDRESPRTEAAAHGAGPESTAGGGHAHVTGRETAEREAAWRRGEILARGRAEGVASPRDPLRGLARPGVAYRAFAALAENVRDYAIFLVDPEGVITFWGEGARLIKWWTKEQAEGAHLQLLYPDGGSEDGTAEDHLRAAAETGEYTGEGHRIRSDGSTFWAGVTLTALRDPDGTLHGFAKVTRDLTAGRATEAARKAALEAAEEANRLKSLFLATMSHELRTPLNAIMAYTDILGMELSGPLAPAQHEHLGKIRSSSQHLLGIVEEVLDLSRIESGRMVVDRSRLRVGTLISQALVLTEPQAATRSVEIVDAVSGFSAEHWYWGDEERVRQILLNLLSNAVKFTGAGGRVTVSAGTSADPPANADLQRPGPWTYVRVEDTGPGIPADRQEAVFEPFVQADMGLTRQHGGTGLGLAISRRLARLLGGDITVHSEEGVGATFFVWLPAAPEESAAPVPLEGPQPGETSAGTLRAVRDAILTELEGILHGYLARIRRAPAPGARAPSSAELEDHLASFLVDVAQSIGALDLASGADSGMLRDSTAIQRTIAERHGRQRARLGWEESDIREEFGVLREELAAAVRRRVRLPRSEEVEEAIRFLDEAVDRAERVSLRTHQLERSE